MNELDLDDMTVLEEQLIGVDLAYFGELLREIKQNERPIDAVYIAELVDRIF